MGCWECWETAGPSAPPPSSQVPVRDPPAPVRGACTQRGEAEVSPMGLRCCQVRRRMRICFHSDPAVSPKRQLSDSCSAAHIRNLDLAKIDNRVGGCVPSTATHLTFRGADTSVRTRLLSDLTQVKPRAPPPSSKDKATTDQSFAGDSSYSLPLSYRVCCLGLSDEVTATRAHSTKGEPWLLAGTPCIPESGGHLGGEGKTLESDHLL